MYQTLPANNLTGISLFNSNNSRRQVQLFLSYNKAEAKKRLFARGTWWSSSVGRAASVSAEFGKGSGHKDSGRGGLSRRLQPFLRDAGSRSIPDSRHRAGPAPSSPPRGPGVLPASTPGLVGPPRPQALGRGGPGRREVPGGCPATPPLAGACPRRAWCRAAGPRAGRKHGGQVTRRPRVLEAQATRRTTFCAQGGPACAHAWPVSDRRPPAGPPLRPALSGAGSTGSVASARPGHRKCGGPAFPPRPPLAGNRRPPHGSARRQVNA